MDHKHFDQETKRLADLIKEHAAIYAIYQFGKGEFEESIQSAGFNLLDIKDWTQGVKPSFDRLRRLARPLAKTVKRLHVEDRFVNITAAAMYSNGVESNIFAYKVYTCKK